MIIDFDYLKISIHAPGEGSDCHRSESRMAAESFQSTLPVKGATRQLLNNSCYYSGFQSTLPVKGATLNHWLSLGIVYFNPRSR